MQNIYTERQLRHQYLIKLISEKEIGRQNDLVTSLKREGFNVTQASVSRDLEFLKIKKREGVYAVERSLSDVDLTVDKSIVIVGENLIVVRCRPGHASALAIMIDDAEFSGVMGTIAGDDTIFVAVVSDNKELIVDQLNEILNG